MPSFRAALCFALCGLASASPIDAGLESRQFGGSGSSGSTRNDLKNGGCKGTMVIFARGTSEAGNVGSVAGPPFFKSLSTKLNGDLAVQGVDYAANWNGALSGGDAAGSKTMASLITQAAQQCPNSNIVISGYSQGAQLVHKAASSLDAGVTRKISSAVVFGDPLNPQQVAGVTNLLSICHPGDTVCRGGSGPSNAHLTYGDDAEKAADFVAQRAPRAGGPSPTTPPTTTPVDSVPTSTATCARKFMGRCW